MVLTGSPRGRDGPGPARGPDRARRDSAAARLARPGLTGLDGRARPAVRVRRTGLMKTGGQRAGGAAAAEVRASLVRARSPATGEKQGAVLPCAPEWAP